MSSRVVRARSSLKKARADLKLKRSSSSVTAAVSKCGRELWVSALVMYGPPLSIAHTLHRCSAFQTLVQPATDTFLAWRRLQDIWWKCRQSHEDHEYFCCFTAYRIGLRSVSLSAANFLTVRFCFCVCSCPMKMVRKWCGVLRSSWRPCATISSQSPARILATADRSVNAWEKAEAHQMLSLRLLKAKVSLGDWVWAVPKRLGNVEIGASAGQSCTVLAGSALKVGTSRAAQNTGEGLLVASSVLAAGVSFPRDSGRIPTPKAGTSKRTRVTWKKVRCTVRECFGRRYSKWWSHCAKNGWPRHCAQVLTASLGSTTEKAQRELFFSSGFTETNF